MNGIDKILSLWIWLGQSQDSVASQQAAADRQRAAVERQLAGIAVQHASLALQRAAARKQARLTPAVEDSFFVTMDPKPVEDFACEPLPLMERQALVDGASRRTGVPRDLLTAVIQQESAFRPCSVSVKGAQGLMQLMPATADDLGVQDAFDPGQNVEAGATFLKSLIDRYGGDLNRALGAYNAGPARVDQAGGVPPISETMRYVERILGRLAPRNPDPVARQ